MRAVVSVRSALPFSDDHAVEIEREGISSRNRFLSESGAVISQSFRARCREIAMKPWEVLGEAPLSTSVAEALTTGHDL